MLGCTAIQVQANTVEKQLQIMFHIDLVPKLSALALLREKSEGKMSIGMSEGVGSAKEKLDEMYSRAQRIMLLEVGAFKMLSR
jgi:hypothetical protein